ncbi:hypothetical protein Tco_0601422 [Tanacetum coccineum]
MLAPKCPTFIGRPTFTNPKYLKKAQSEIPCLYEIPHDQSDPVNRLVPDREETLTLKIESRSKLNKDLVKPYDYTKQNKLVDQAWEKHSHNHFHAPTALDMEQEMHADLKYVESLEKEIDELESDKAEFSNMYDMLLQECVSNDVMCSYLHSLSDLDAHSELQCLYLHKVKECECLAQKLSKQTESVSKEVYTKLLRSFAKLEKHSISLELALQQCQEQMTNDTVCKEKASNVFQKEREQYFEIQDLKAQLQDKNIAISELKKLIEKCKGKSVETKFDKPFVVRQPNAQRIPKPSVLGKPAPFLESLERKGVIHKTNVNRPQLRSTQMKDKVVPNNSQVKDKKTEVEDHPKISSISNKTKSITMSNDSLKSRTLNVNAIVQLILFIVDSRCTKHITGNLGTVQFGNDQFAPILDFEVAFQKSICFVRDLQGRLSYLNFDYINLHLKKDVVIGLPKLKYVKDQLCSSYEVSKAKRSSFKIKVVPSSKGRLNLLHMDSSV